MKPAPFVPGRFLREGKTRFVCWCEVEGHRRKCYVPMSTKLSRYFDPVGKEVRIEKKGTRLWIEQVKLRGRWIWVDAAKATGLLRKELERQGKTVATEKTVEGYRFDLWCEGVGYEVKSVLSDRKVLVYPNAESQRRDQQLARLRMLVKKGMTIVWAFVVFSPTALKLDLKNPFGRSLWRVRAEGLDIEVWEVRGKKLVWRALSVPFKKG